MTLWTWNDDARSWTPVGLPADRLYPLGPDATLVPVADGRCGLLTSGRVRVNGQPALLIKVLSDRDEVELPDRVPHYVTVDAVVEVVPFPAGGRLTRCARCGSPLQAGDPSVVCPRCHVTCHQMPDLPCWSHSDTCPACLQPTVGFAWQPMPWTPLPTHGQAGGADA